MITFNHYVRAKSIDEAYELNRKYPNRVIGGMLWLKTGCGSFDTVIDLCALGLDAVDETETEFSVGAYVTLRQLETHNGLDAYSHGALKDALKNVIGVQLRNTATVGGTVWGRFGFSELLTVLCAMDSYVELYKGGTVPLNEFMSMARERDIVLRLIIKKSPIDVSYGAMRVQSTDFPLITCAVSRVCGEYRTVIGSRPMRAYRVSGDNGLLSGGINDVNAAQYADYIRESVPVSGNLRAGTEYRKHLVRVLTERGIRKIGGLD